jgi:uncharacterized protein (DUF169 family)
MEFAEISRVLTNNLKLGSAPIGVTPLQEAPAGVKSFAGQVPSACSLWRVAESGMFYAPAEAHHNCPVGAYTQGLPITAAVEKMLMEFAGFMTKAKYLDPAEIEKLPRLEGSPSGYLYGPLAEYQAVPTLVLMWVSPRQLMLAEEATGDLAWTSTSAKAFGRPACAALPVAAKSSRPVVSLGCAGMRTFTEVADDLALFVVPGVELEAFTKKLQETLASNEQMLAFYQQHKSNFPSLNSQRAS